jgi:glycosyltransferase involved in cell wall biosynthesis
MRQKSEKSILYIVHHRLNRSPGQRYRCEQYLRYLEEAGFSYTFSPIIKTSHEDYCLYQSSRITDKAFVFLKSFFRRIRDVFRAYRYDYIFIYREAFLTGSVFFERLLKWSGAKIILDFDDAIWLPDISEANKKLSFLKRPGKINDIINLSDIVIVGNEYLRQYASRMNPNTVIFPSTIDLDYYQYVPKKTTENQTIVIGWSGSHTTIKHFETIVPVLKMIKQKFGEDVVFKVYGDKNYHNEELNITGIQWSHETEVDVISSFDIGIMPLPNDQWSQGKCAMKGLQYMGLGIPAVLAPVGMNKDVIQHGVNGFLASSEDDWMNCLSELVKSKELRLKLGKNGRLTVEQKFSCQQLHDRYVDIFLA